MDASELKGGVGVDNLDYINTFRTFLNKALDASNWQLAEYWAYSLFSALRNMNDEERGSEDEA